MTAKAKGARTKPVDPAVQHEKDEKDRRARAKAHLRNLKVKDIIQTTLPDGGLYRSLSPRFCARDPFMEDVDQTFYLLDQLEKFPQGDGQ